MSLQHSPEGPTAYRVLLACAKAIKALEEVTAGAEQHKATYDDGHAIAGAVRRLWSVIEDQGYTIDVDTNRLVRRVET